VKLNIMPLCTCSAMWWAIHRPGLVMSNKRSTVWPAEPARSFRDLLGHLATASGV
jgi:hypothetical protein